MSVLPEKIVPRGPDTHRSGGRHDGLIGEPGMDLNGKRVVAIGERDGVTGPSLKMLAESAGADVVFSVTQCFV